MKGLRDQEALAQPTCGHHRPADWFGSGQLKFFGFLEGDNHQFDQRAAEWDATKKRHWLFLRYNDFTSQ